jgi:hypothetical protein
MEIIFGNQVNSDLKNLIINNHLTKENCEILLDYHTEIALNVIFEFYPVQVYL